MKGDFSRDTYDKAKHFSRVLMQQGRVQLDSDWNEQTAILLHYLRTLAADLIGPFAGPEGDNYGFKVEVVKEESAENNDFRIMILKGRYYVDSILCENESDLSYTDQQDFLNPPKLVLDQQHKYVVYLDVWERHVSAIEDDNIREKALGGPDTASRAKVIWQVKCDAVVGALTKTNIKTLWPGYIERWQPPHLGCLKARVKPHVDSLDPCLAAPEAKYRGTENQLYRVEIHKRGREGEATFKWSRDNGAVVSGCKLEGVELTVDNPHGFSAGQWMELTNDGRELRGEPGELVKIVRVEGEIFILEAAPASLLLEKDGPLKVRRWDQSENEELELVEGAIPVQENTAGEDKWIELEDGIQIQFQSLTSAEEHRYRTGDYWLIPARVETGDIEWPVMGPGDPKSVPPHGIRHHYAPLAILGHESSEWNPEDLRCSFRPLGSCIPVSYGEDGMGGAPAECPKEDGVRVPRGTLTKRTVSSTRKPQGKRPR